MRLLTVFGTRPEAIKLAPVLFALRQEAAVLSLTCVTGQHRELLDQSLRFFDIAPDFDLDVMEAGQGLNRLAARVFERMDAVFDAALPDRLLVQGDTTTAAAAAIAAFHRRIPVAHVEAGLRTYCPGAPWPEEVNRRVIALAADLHFAPTAAAKANLLAERLQGEVYITGNTGIDALHHVVERLAADRRLRAEADAVLPRIDPARKLLLVTAHRRENIGATFRGICTALAMVARRRDVEILFPVHPNPVLRRAAERSLSQFENAHLIRPLEPAAFVRSMQRADLILTDSGGVQEEAVALGKPVLVTREVTERSEAVTEGAARLAGTNSRRLFRQIDTLLDDPDLASRFARRPTLFGDGMAGRRIVAALLGRRVEEFRSEAEPAPAQGVTAAAE